MKKTEPAENLGTEGAKSDAYGQISIRVDKADFEKLTEIQGMLMILQKCNVTKAEAIHATIDTQYQRLKTAIVLQKVEDFETK
jgi:hypothetical protein